MEDLAILPPPIAVWVPSPIYFMDQNYLGIIEGFYGQKYSDLERKNLLTFMQENKYKFYIYAPKADEQLRDQWGREISLEYKHKLQTMSQDCAKASLDFGIALSPLNLTETFEQNKDLILQRVKELCDYSKCQIFCLLFDDMKKSSEDVGAIQNKIIRLVESHLSDHIKHFIICPSYYTDDPLIDRIFGKCPEHYFEQLTQDLPERVEIFWTGPNVLSDDYTQEHLESVIKRLGRKPFIWDNYPVNDGISIYHYLFLKRFQGRKNMAKYVTGHAVNPMVQPVLSTLAEITLPLIYEGKSEEEINKAYVDHAKKLFGNATHELLNNRNFKLLTEVGLNKMTAQEKARLLEFCSLDDTPALAELKDFLQGSKRFDQAIINGTHAATVDYDQKSSN